MFKTESPDTTTANHVHVTAIKTMLTEGQAIDPDVFNGTVNDLPVSPVSFDITRFFDVVFSFCGLIVLSPLLLVIACLIKLTSKGPVIFAQPRVGRYGVDFTLYKFRTMFCSPSERTLTVGSNDSRITRAGKFLRRFKLDELPQLYNVLMNDMSIVGPRPELRKYVNFYDAVQREILNEKPGITDYASIIFRNESALLGEQPDPEKYYIDKVIPAKIKLNRKYSSERNLKSYFTIVFRTFASVFA